MSRQIHIDEMTYEDWKILMEKTYGAKQSCFIDERWSDLSKEEIYKASWAIKKSKPYKCQERRYFFGLFKEIQHTWCKWSEYYNVEDTGHYIQYRYCTNCGDIDTKTWSYDLGN